MRILLLLLALYGAAKAFVPGREYNYEYITETKIGFPNVGPDQAIAALRANVTIFANSAEDLVIQMEKVEVMTEIDISKGGDHGEDMVAFKPITGQGILMMEPFQVFFKKDQNDVMRVGKDEPEWIVNMKKGLVNCFRSYPLVGNETKSSSKPLPYFTRMENTIFGKCEIEYTVEEITHQMLPMPGGHHVPMVDFKICEQGAYNVSRSVNFNKCQERNVLQLTGLSNRTTGGHESHGSMESRSSDSYVVMCGADSATMEVFNVSTSGSFTLSPYGFQTEKMMAFTNQTFRIRNFKTYSPGAKKLRLKDLRSVDTWISEVVSPFKSTGNERPWVKFENNDQPLSPYIFEAMVTGLNHDSVQKSFKEKVKTNIEKTAASLLAPPKPTTQGRKVYDTTESEIPGILMETSRLIRSLNDTDIDEIYNDFQNRPPAVRQNQIERILLLDVMVSSGHPYAITFLLAKIASGDISDIRAKTIFMTLTNNVANPEIVKILLDFVKNNVKIESKPYLTTTALINVASTIRRVCVDANTVRYSVPYDILGTKRCDANAVLTDYLSFLEEQLKSSQKPFERSVYAEAIANLGSVQALPVIKEVIRGEHGRNASIRVIGIYGLLHFRIPDAPLYEIEQTLLPLIEDFQEDIELRQTAVFVMASWHPKNYFWQRLATLTWREPSRQMGSFIYSLIMGRSKSTVPKDKDQAKYAKAALEKVKPYPPSVMYSSAHLWTRYSPAHRHATEFAYTRIHSNDSSVPKEVFMYFYNAFGGLDYTTFESCSYAFNADEVLNRVYRRIVERMRTRNPRSGKRAMDYTDFYTIIKEELKFEEKEKYPYQFLQVFRLFDHMQVFAPIDDDILNITPERGTEFIKKLMEGMELNMVKFFDPATNEMYIPLDSGLTLANRISYPIVLSVIGYAKLRVPGVNEITLIDLLTSPEVEFGFDRNAKFISTYRAGVSALAPWNKKEVYGEVHSTVNYNDPSQLNITQIYTVNRSHKNTTLSVYAHPNIESAYPAMHTHNIPLVGIRSMYPDQSPDQQKVVYVADEPLQSNDVPISMPITGYSGYLRFSGDTENAYTNASIYNYLFSPQAIMRAHSPTVKHWDYELVVEPGRSETKFVNASISTWIPTTEVSTTDKNFTDILNKNVDRTRDFTLGATARVYFNGTKNRYYKVSVGYVETEVNSTLKKSGFRLNFHRGPKPGVDEDDGAFCYNTSATLANVFDYKSLRDIIRSESANFRSKGQYYSGNNCRENRLGDVDMGMEVSRTEADKVYRSISDDGTYTPFNPHEPMYDKFYLHVTFDQNKVPRGVRNVTYKVYDLFRGYAFPNIYFEYEQNSHDSVIKVNASRLSNTHKWNGTIYTPQELSKFDYLKVYRGIYQIMMTNDIHDKKFECIFRHNKVKTFDSEWHDFDPRELAKCYTVVAANKKYPGRIDILVRDVFGPERSVAVSSHEFGTTVEVFATGVKVNGEAFDVPTEGRWVIDEMGRNFAIAMPVNDGYRVDVPFNVTAIATKEELLIRPYKSLTGYLNGFCGDYNTEYTKDMVGPANCIHNNVTTFHTSWTISSGDNCDKTALERDRQEVTEFQETCARANLPFPVWEARRQRSNLVFVYTIRQKDDFICVSTVSTGYCRQSSGRQAYHLERIPYNCYRKNRVPVDVKPNVSRGFMKVPPVEIPEITDMLRTRNVYLCA